MKSTRRAFMQFLGAAVVGLTIALPTRTFGHDEFEYLPGDEFTIRVGGAIDKLVQRSMENRMARMQQFVVEEATA